MRNAIVYILGLYERTFLITDKIKRDEEFSRGNLYAVLRFTVYVMLMHGLDKQAVFSDTLLCRSLM